MKIFRRLIALALLIAGLAFTGFLLLHNDFVRPGPLDRQAILIIPKGAGLDQISRILENGGIVEFRWGFILGTRLAGSGRDLKSGEYVFPAKVSAQGAMQILKVGRTLVRRLTVPEGLTSEAVLSLVYGATGLEGDLDGNFPEGSLFPETYHYSWGDSRGQMTTRMKEAMTTTLAELWPLRDKGLPFKSPAEALVLASIVEKETGLAEERQRIAAVFLNRLKKNMRLQSDPTVAYALAPASGDLGRPLTRKDLETQSPYNTYLNKGLPPGPICNPGRGSIEAVLAPAKSKELYFVADGTGGHAFARTLKEHNRNVARWRKFNSGR